MNYLKRQNGITMISLVVTIIVLVILSSMVTHTGISSIKNTRFERFKNELEIVQKNDKMLNKKVLTIAGVAYSGGKDMDKYLVSPINGPLDKLEDVIIYTGTYDILNPDVKILEERAKKVGNTINIYETEKATHIWLLYKYKDKENDELVEEPYNKMIELLKNN